MRKGTEWGIGTTALLVIGIIMAAGYFALPQIMQKGEDPVWAVPEGNPQHGAGAIIRYGCFSCHEIAGIRKATGRVGPKLHDIREQMYIGGVLANSPDNMAKWVRNPRRFSPETAMPDLGVMDQDVLDIAAYLYKH
ncbi:c-type cytochrome [Desulfopila inferna]|uniref:c-type cytochrome n=1 Tax=Desulfopila inferna TaxID=468528 RepID=UPI001962A0A0|nr:c-type cytochrome [Desulfopila inferna]MBM9606067.1 c-type cytochrome [Desulfopila inferna]